VSVAAGVMGVIVPFLSGWGLALILFPDLGPGAAIFIGLTLSATSVSISAQTLMELGHLRSRVGLALLGAAVFDDILVILFVSNAFIVFGGGGGGAATILTTILLMVFYLVAASAAGYFIVPRLVDKISNIRSVSQGVLSLAVVLCLLFAWAAEAIGGMAAITGAFLIGLFLGRTNHKERLEHGLSAMAYSFFVPVFFVHIGLSVDIGSIGSSAIPATIIICVIAVVGKLVGSGFGARISGFNTRESVQLGIGMVSRGEVGLIVATFAFSEGLFEEHIFAIMVVMVIVATLLTPIMLRYSFRKKEVEV
jgi:Kef-type K+ transport system membrane component KefB